MRLTPSATSTNVPEELLTALHTWERELENLSLVQLPQCYTPADMDCPDTKRNIHIFCDASERAYGSLAFLWSEDVWYMLLSSSHTPEMHFRNNINAQTRAVCGSNRSSVSKAAEE